MPAGGEETFWILGDGGVAYLRFPLNSLPAGAQITRAELIMNIHPNSTAGGTNAWLQLVDPLSAWMQESLTWNNAPVPDKNGPTVLNAPLAGYTGPGAQDVFDVTTLLQYALEQGRPDLDIVLGGMNLGEHSQEWYSSESGQGPALLVTP
jgi:hypothetical protein